MNNIELLKIAKQEAKAYEEELQNNKKKEIEQLSCKLIEMQNVLTRCVEDCVPESFRKNDIFKAVSFIDVDEPKVYMHFAGSKILITLANSLSDFEKHKNASNYDMLNFKIEYSTSFGSSYMFFRKPELWRGILIAIGLDSNSQNSEGFEIDVV